MPVPLPEGVPSSHLRLQHADAIIEELQTDIGVMLDLAPVEVVVSHDPTRGESTAWVRATELPLNEWGLRAGDAIHALRASLDHLVWELCLPLELPPWHRDYLAFPIYRQRAGYLASTRPGTRGLPADLLAPELMQQIEACQPFQSETPLSDPLWRLHELATLDRTQIVPVIWHVEVTEFVSQAQGAPVPAEGLNVVPGGATRSGDQLARWPTLSASGSPVGIRPLIQTTIRFGEEAGTAAREPVVLILQAIAAHVRGVLERISSSAPPDASHADTTPDSESRDQPQ